MATLTKKTRPKPVGRPANRKDEVVDYLRRSIVSGQLKPGGRMPTREQIIRQFSASPVTVNSALAELRNAGFVEVRGNQGTFVHSALPHLTRYAVAFGQPKGTIAGMGYTASFAKECARVHKTQIDQRELEIVPFYDLDRMWDSPDYVRLVSEVRAHRLGGIITANYLPAVLEGDEFIASKIPMVSHGGSIEDTAYSRVQMDSSSRIELSLQYLAECGARRPAILSGISSNAKYSLETWIERAAVYGMTFEPYWIQHVALAEPNAARSNTYMMMMLSGERRPDSLIITDDNLVPYAVEGLRDAGLTPDDAFPIVAHANFPWPTACSLPALRVGYDLRELIRVCVEIIDRMRANRGITEHVLILATSMLQVYCDAMKSDGASEILTVAQTR